MFSWGWSEEKGKQIPKEGFRGVQKVPMKAVNIFSLDFFTWVGLKILLSKGQKNMINKHTTTCYCLS